MLNKISLSVHALFLGPKPTVSNNAFEDLLGSQGFSASSKPDEPKTISSMRQKQLEEEMDPEKLKVICT